MVFAWANTFVPATGSSGLNSGDHTATDEWIFSRADNCFVQDTAGGTSFPTFTFDMSAGPGDKKGFWIWVEWYCDNANGYRVDEIRLVEAGGPTTLWTNSAPGISITQTSGGEKHWVIPIPDSAFSGDPAINQLRVEFDVTNLHTGNNRLRFSGIRLSKSPFTAAQEVALPSSLSGQDYAVYTAAGLGVLGAANNEDIVLIPDQSGGGRHLLRRSGTTCQYKTADGGYVDFPSTANRFIACWGTRVTGNHIWHTEIYPEDTGLTQGVWSYALEFVGVVEPATDPNDKNILGIDDAGSGDKFLLMSGDGSGGAHQYGATTVTFDAWVRPTQWVQDSGNEHLWINDDASPDIDASSGSNNLYTYSFGNRESNDRPFQGRMKEFWVVEDQAVGVTENNIDDARDDTIWGGAGGGSPQTLTGALFSSPAAFISGLVSSAVTLSGVLFDSPPAFISGSIISQITLLGSVFSKPPQFNSGTLTSSITLTGALFSSPPSFIPGTLTSAVTLSGSLFSSPPAFIAGDLEPGNVNLSGALFSSQATFIPGSLSAGAVTLDGTLFTSPPAFSSGLVSAGNELAGTLFSSPPTFLSGALTVDQTVSGVLFSTPAAFISGTLVSAITLPGAVFNSPPSFLSGSLTPGNVTISGVTFTSPPSFGLGFISAGGVAIQGVLFSSPPNFAPGDLLPGNITASGVLFSSPPAFLSGQVFSDQFLIGVLFSSPPAFISGTLASGAVILSGQLFSSPPAFSSGVLIPDQIATGQVFSSPPNFISGSVLPGGVSIVGALFVSSSTFTSGSISSVFGLVGILFSSPPTFSQGQLSAEVTVSGAIFSSPPTFLSGQIGFGLVGVTFLSPPTFISGLVRVGIAGQTFSSPPTFISGFLLIDLQVLSGFLFEASPSFPLGALIAEATLAPGGLRDPIDGVRDPIDGLRAYENITR